MIQKLIQKHHCYTEVRQKKRKSAAMALKTLLECEKI